MKYQSVKKKKNNNDSISNYCNIKNKWDRIFEMEGHVKPSWPKNVICIFIGFMSVWWEGGENKT